MGNFHRLTVLVALLLMGCSGLHALSRDEPANALAPTGTLRVAFISGSPIHATRDAVSGEFKGVAIDLGKELARRIGVPFKPVPYSSVPALLAAAKDGEWDVATLGVNAERALAVDFSAPYMEVEFGYLVPGGSSIASLSEVDRPGVRIGVVEKASPDVYLNRTIRSATLVRAPSVAGLFELLHAGKVDAVFATKASILSQAAKFPGSRVLEGRSGGEETAMAAPKGRGEASRYLREFVESVKAEGLVKAAIERAALRGVAVAVK
ncbi:MAG: transporter substrate-binding domain-containing protein [Rhodospirillaceae bacterium]